MVEFNSDTNRNGWGDIGFNNHRPLVEEANANDFIFQLTADDVTNEFIEERYGPLDSRKATPDIPTPTKPVSKFPNADLEKQLREIELLKKTIMEKEQLALGRRLEEEALRMATPEASITQELEKLEEIEVCEEQEIKELMAVKDEKIKHLEQLDSAPALPTASRLPSTEYQEDSGSDMDVSSSGSSPPPINNILLDIESDIANTDDIVLDDARSDSGDSYCTAKEEFSEDDVLLRDLEYEKSLIDSEIEELEKKLKSIEENDKEIHLKLTYLKVKLSMAKFKKKPTASKPSGSKRPSTSTPPPPYKRTHHESNVQNPNQSYNYPISYYPSMNHMPHRQNASNPYPSYEPIGHALYQPPYMHSNIPPPPPPTDLPPPLSPPPPPPPPTAPKLFNQNVEIGSLGSTDTRITGETQHQWFKSYRLETNTKDIENLRNTLRKVEQLISFRLFDSKNNLPSTQDRPLPRPRRLVTIDDYTMTMNMVFLDKSYEINNLVLRKEHQFLLPAGRPVLFTMTDEDYESPLFILLYRKALGKKFDKYMESAILAILISIPSDYDLSTFHMMRIETEKLENTYNLVCAFNQDYPQNHLLAALKLELVSYIYGPGSLQFQLEYDESVRKMPLSVDIHWQYIVEEDAYQTRLNRIKEILILIGSKRSKNNQEAWVDYSGMTVELLTRLIRIGGIKDVLKIITRDESFEINTTKAAIFSLNEINEVFLLEEDKYYLWMLVLHYYVMKTLPHGVCDMWMSSLVKDGKPSVSKTLFSIDWTEALKDNPLETESLCGATNILLSMLAHFGKETTKDIKKKPLLIGVLRTLVTFLSHAPCYMIHGVLVLTKTMEEIEMLSPEIQEILMDLELKIQPNLKTIISRLFDQSERLSRSQTFAIAYRAVCLYCDHINYTTENIVLLACILSIPLASSNTNRRELENIILNHIQSIDYTAKVAMVKRIRSNYQSMLSADSSPAPSAQEATFVWINLLLLHKICEMLCPNEKEEIHQQMRRDYDEGRNYLTSPDAKLLLSKYANQLVDDIN